jgi:DNA-binding NarL/FixJ family response regulator
MKMKTKIRVFLADDHAIIRDGLTYILEAQNDITVVGDAADGEIAIEKIKHLVPDVVLMDISMPILNGIETTRIVTTKCPSVKVVILSIFATSEYIHRALRSGARGYVLKESASKEVVEAIRQVHTGHRYLSSKIMDAVVNDYIADENTLPGKSPIETLSPREQRVLQLVVEGRTSAEISKILHLSAKTIETYRSRIMNKLKINDMAGLVKFTIRHGITSVD